MNTTFKSLLLHTFNNMKTNLLFIFCRCFRHCTSCKSVSWLRDREETRLHHASLELSLLSWWINPTATKKKHFAKPFIAKTYPKVAPKKLHVWNRKLNSPESIAEVFRMNSFVKSWHIQFTTVRVAVEQTDQLWQHRQLEIHVITHSGQSRHQPNNDKNARKQHFQSQTAKARPFPSILKIALRSRIGYGTVWTQSRTQWTGLDLNAACRLSATCTCLDKVLTCSECRWQSTQDVQISSSSDIVQRTLADSSITLSEQMGQSRDASMQCRECWEKTPDDNWPSGGVAFFLMRKINQWVPGDHLNLFQSLAQDFILWRWISREICRPKRSGSGRSHTSRSQARHKGNLVFRHSPRIAKCFDPQ